MKVTWTGLQNGSSTTVFTTATGLFIFFVSSKWLRNWVHQNRPLFPLAEQLIRPGRFNWSGRCNTFVFVSLDFTVALWRCCKDDPAQARVQANNQPAPPRRRQLFEHQSNKMALRPHLIRQCELPTASLTYLAHSSPAQQRHRRPSSGQQQWPHTLQATHLPKNRTSTPHKLWH